MNEPSETSKHIIRVILADDHSLIRQALKMSIERQADLEVIGEASNGEEALNLSRSLKPDVIVMDISMPILNGIEATGQITKENHNVAVLVLTIHSDISTITRILSAGARGYLIKTATAKQVIEAIRTVYNGEAVLPLVAAREIIQNNLLDKDATSLNVIPKLSPRELELLKLLAKGLPNKLIAERLHLQETSIKSYLNTLFFKLDVGTRAEAVSKGLQIGYISVDDFKDIG
ncbi:MAG: response regulator transcription factor [Dehalococcoidales bacterium]|nr:response regulator transcription factor [Dehalococcoidales bacterium]